MLFGLVLCTLAWGDRPIVPVHPVMSEAGAVHPSRLLIQPAPGVGPAALERLHRRLGAQLVRDMPAIRWQVVEVDPERLAERRGQYAESALVERAEFDHARQLAYTPNDAMYPNMWHVPHMNVDDVWDTTKGSSSVVVAVLDTGCEIAHPDLAANIWVNPGEIPSNGLDDDNDGLIDDVSGWDFVANDAVVEDVNGHGTSCSGIVAAVQDNSIGVTGVAPLCKVLPLKAGNDAGYFYDSAVVPAILYAADRGAKVLSMSFYGDSVTPAERAAIDYAWSLGALPIAAAGNDAQIYPYYPGAYEHTLGVGSHSSSNLKSSFSNWGSWVDVAAPGEGIRTTRIGGLYTSSFAGTSAACPNVAGIAALLFSGVPGATNAEVRAAIEDSAIGLNQAPYGVWANYGRVDALAALTRLLGAVDEPDPARLLFMSPVGGRLGLVSTRLGESVPDLLFYGVGLEEPSSVRVLQNSFALPILSQSRNEVHALRGASTAPKFSLEVNSQTIQSLYWDDAPGWLFAPSDINAKLPAVATGGFLQLYRNDGIRATCTRETTPQKIVLKLAIRKVRGSPIRRMHIEWTRAYTDCMGGTETVELYDWQSASYPYGNFVTVHSQAINTAAELHFTESLYPNPGRFLDDEGTAYVRITATNAGASALLSMDSFRLHLE